MVKLPFVVSPCPLIALRADVAFFADAEEAAPGMPTMPSLPGRRWTRIIKGHWLDSQSALQM
jgi:hypothetical protein